MAICSRMIHKPLTIYIEQDFQHLHCLQRQSESRVLHFGDKKVVMKLTSSLSVWLCICFYFNLRNSAASDLKKKYCFTQNNEVTCENIENVKLARLSGQEVSTRGGTYAMHAMQ